MITIPPGVPFEATADFTYSGSASTIGVKIIDNVGGTPLGRVLCDREAATNLYAKAFNAGQSPTIAGQYTLAWDDSATGVVAYEDLIVAYTLGSLAAPSGSDLTTVTAAKNWLGETDTSQDSRLQQLVTAASGAVMAYCQREFAPVSTSTTRTFPLLEGGLIRFGGWDLQAVTGAGVQIDMDTASTPTTIPDTQYQLGPVSKPNGVYTYLRFYTFAVGPILRQAYGIPRQVAVTGTWGWPSIPADVAQAATITVAKWFKRDQVAWSSELPDPSTSPLTDGLSLPYDARVLLAPYRRPL